MTAAALKTLLRAIALLRGFNIFLSHLMNFYSSSFTAARLTIDEQQTVGNNAAISTAGMR